MLWRVLFLSTLCLQTMLGQFTKRENVLLSRKKRYLFFPNGANFVYQFVNVKPLMRRVPKGLQWLNEWDVPFALPSNPGEFREYRKKHRKGRDLLDDFTLAFGKILFLVVLHSQCLWLEAIMKVSQCMVGLLCLQLVIGQELTTIKVNRLLSRKKRYLLFPKGSNFIFAFINVKIFMILAPKYAIWFNEWTVTFPLPFDPKELRKLRRKHRVHRRHLQENFSFTLSRYGLNGTACVNRMICEAREFIPVKGKSLIKDMLYAVFSRPEEEDVDNTTLGREDVCHTSNFEECTAPLLHIMLGSFNNY